MNSDLSSLEAELRALRAAPLDEAFLARLEAAADGNLTELGPEYRCLENQLRAVSPTSIASDHMAGLEALFQDVPFPVDEKILLFPKAAAVAERTTTTRRPMWATAAAVAIIGAATALMMPTQPPASRIASNTSTPSLPLAPAPTVSAVSNNLVPAGFDRGVSTVRNEGVVWKNDSQPHSLMHVEYVDKITLKDQFGRTFQVEKPGVRYMLVPAKID